MTLRELSAGYRASAQLLHQRIAHLQHAARCTQDPEEKWHLRRRISELRPLLEQMQELADLTEHYYDRGYWRSEKYTL